MLQQEHTKRVKYYYIDFQMNTHSSLHLPLPPLFLKGEMKFPKNWVGRLNFKKSVWKTKRGEVEEIQRLQGVMIFFIFLLSLLAMMVTNTVFRKSSSEDLFLKKWSLVLLIISHIILTCQFSVLNLDLHLFVSP